VIIEDKSFFSIRTVLAILSVAACDISFANGNGPLDFQVLNNVGLPLHQQSFLAINSLESWTAALGNGTVTKTAQIAEIDFTRYTLLAVALGPSTGHTVIFSGVREYDDKVVVRILDIAVSGPCAVPEMTTFPNAVAVIPHTLKPVQFWMSPAALPCNDLVKVTVSPH